jgi:hypothetical protein
VLNNNTNIFIQCPDEYPQRVLLPGRVVGVNDQTYSAAMAQGESDFSAGQNVLVYYDLKGKFTQQSARIDAVMRGGTSEGESDNSSLLVIGFQITGEPSSAESRESYRACAVIRDLQAAVNKEQQCLVLDISATGLAVVTQSSYAVNQQVAVAMDYLGKAYTGQGNVQSVRKMDDDRWRVGLHVPTQLNGNLERGLQLICVAIQRQQLTRLSGMG